MAELDAELSSRLACLAAAVPVSSGQLDVVHRNAVRARQSVRMAWVTPLVVLVIGATVLGLLGVNPFGAREVSRTTRVGDFELTIRSAKAVYETGEPIDISASVAYVGPDGAQEIAYIPGGPIGFGFVEPVLGDLVLGPVSNLGGRPERATLSRGSPIAQDFRKTGGWSLDEPRAQEKRAFFDDPVLRLPIGTWHPYAVAVMWVGDDPVDATVLQAEIELEVNEGAATTPIATAESRTTPDPTTGNAPSSMAPPTFEPENAGLEAEWISDENIFLVGIHSDHRIYRESDPIQITGKLRYLGDVAMDVSAFRPLQFSIREPVNGLSLDARFTRMECASQRVLPGMQVEAPFYKAGSVSSLDPDYGAKLAYLSDPVLRLPPGSWHVKVSGSTSVGQGCLFEGDSWSAELEITVLPDTATRMDLITGGFGDAAECRSRVTSGALARDEGTGVGVKLEGGTVQRILWPYGYSAWNTADGAVLIGEDGQVVAREGQRLSIRGMDEPGWLIRAGCIETVTRPTTDVVLP